MDTETREVKMIQNPYTMFEKILYDDSKEDYTQKDVNFVDNKFVKIVVINRKDLFTFDSFVDKIQNNKLDKQTLESLLANFSKLKSN